MKAIQYRSAGGLSNLNIVQTSSNRGSRGPAEGEIRVKIHACSLNRHDYNVALGVLPVENGRIIMSDGVGIIEAIGTEVAGFAIGDRVVPTFFPDWRQGAAPLATFARTSGDGLDGYGVETVVRPANWFTHVPRDWRLTEAATLPDGRFDGMACPCGRGTATSWPRFVGPWHWRRVDLRPSIRKADGHAGHRDFFFRRKTETRAGPRCRLRRQLLPAGELV